MELVEGETLAAVIQRGPMFVKDTCKVARQIAEALEAAHDKGVSPEQAEGLPVDKRADVWSFGVLRLEMLTGKRLAFFPRPAVEQSQGSLHATFLLNFFDEVRRRVPANK